MATVPESEQEEMVARKSSILEYSETGREPSDSERVTSLVVGLGTDDAATVTCAWMIGHEIGLGVDLPEDLRLNYGTTPYSPELHGLIPSADISDLRKQIEADEALNSYLRLGEVLSDVPRAQLKRLGRSLLSDEGEWDAADERIEEIEAQVEA